MIKSVLENANSFTMLETVMNHKCFKGHSLKLSPIKNANYCDICRLII